jgi:hypothetical protein
MEYNVDYFIKKFEAIPEERWFKGSFHSPDLKQSCALGHCVNNDEEFEALHALTRHGEGSEVALINDGKHPLYGQETPKQRILAALNDIKKAQQPDIIISEVKERIVYVTLDAPVRDLQKKELSLQ